MIHESKCEYDSFLYKIFRRFFMIDIDRKLREWVQMLMYGSIFISRGKYLHLAISKMFDFDDQPIRSLIIHSGH